jgi:hypothetical protein
MLKQLSALALVVVGTVSAQKHFLNNLFEQPDLSKFSIPDESQIVQNNYIWDGQSLTDLQFQETITRSVAMNAMREVVFNKNGDFVERDTRQDMTSEEKIEYYVYIEETCQRTPGSELMSLPGIK